MQQTWRLWFSKTGVHAICEFSRERFSLAPAAFENDERMRGFEPRSFSFYCLAIARQSQAIIFHS